MPTPTKGTRGFTILEVLAVVVIVAILAALVVPRLGTYRERAEEVRCTANMRTIIIALASYLQDHGHIWPQAPSIEEEKIWEAFWLQALTPYEVTPRTWQCPSLWPRTGRNPEFPQVHYTPMAFNAEPADGHRQGPLIGFQDGSIKSFHKILAEQGAMESP